MKISGIKFFSPQKSPALQFGFKRKAGDAERIDALILGKLIETKQNGQNITGEALAQYAGISATSLYQKISKNPAMAELWDEVKKGKTQRKQKIDEKSPESLNIAQNIPQEENIEEIKPKVSEISQIEPENEKPTINIEKSTKRPRPTGEEVLRQKEQIRNILKSAKANNEKMTLTQLSEETGLSKTALQNRRASDPHIKDLWNSVIVSERHLDDAQEKPLKAAPIKPKPTVQENQQKQKEYAIRRKEEDDKIKRELAENTLRANVINFILQKARDNERVTYGEIMENTGAARAQIDKFVREYKAQKEQSTIKTQKSAQPNTTHMQSQAPKKELPKTNLSQDEIAKIQNILEETLSNRQKISLEEIAKRLDVIPKEAYRAIRGDEYMTSVWNKVKRLELSDSEKKAREADLKIDAAIKEAIRARTVSDIQTIAKKAGVSTSILQNRLSENSDLNDSWHEMLNLRKVIRVQSILENAVESGDKVSIMEISQKLSLQTFEVYNIIQSDPVLKNLYKRI